MRNPILATGLALTQACAAGAPSIQHSINFSEKTFSANTSNEPDQCKKTIDELQAILRENNPDDPDYCRDLSFGSVLAGLACGGNDVPLTPDQQRIFERANILQSTNCGGSEQETESYGDPYKDSDEKNAPRNDPNKNNTASIPTIIRKCLFAVLDVGKILLHAKGQQKPCDYLGDVRDAKIEMDQKCAGLDQDNEVATNAAGIQERLDDYLNTECAVY